jgi:hypothetical protein
MEDWSGNRAWGRRAVSITAALFLAAIGSYAAPGTCDKGPSYYDGYMITRVDIRNPIGFITPWFSISKKLKPGLRLKASGSFNWQSFEQDSEYLSSMLKTEFPSSQLKFKLAYAGGDLEDCDPDARTLRVVYPIFTSAIPFLIPPSIEQQSNESDHPATTGALRAADKPLRVTPLAGYNHTRGIFGGTSFVENVKHLQIQGETEDSAKSRLEYLGISSKIGPVNRLLNDGQLAMNFDYQDTPAGDRRFKEGKLILRLSASTQETAKDHIIFRYGIALEGGHQQSSNASQFAEQVPNSGYGSMKFYVGLTGRPGNSAFTLNYGLQLGRTLGTGLPVFKKHLVDLGYNISIPIPFRKPMGDREDFRGPLSPRVHRSLTLETRFTAGLIQDVAGTPLAERFLGGNQVRPFIQNGSWVILSDPFIRSIPENQLGAQNVAQFGGSRFYSANATVSYSAWGKPLLPKELAAPGTQFPEVLNPGFQTAAITLANSYKTRDPEYIRLTAKVPSQATELSEKLNVLSGKLKTIPPDVASQAASAKLLKSINRNLASTRNAARLLSNGADPQVIDQLGTNLIPALSSLTSELSKSLREASLSVLSNQIDSLMNDIKALGTEIDQASSLPLTKYEDQAWQELAPGHHAIDVFLHQLNIFSISPLVAFDVARVWPVNEGVRYGVGPGLRFSLVNTNFTLGYSFNLQRTNRENAGALFFKLDVTTLF